MFAKDGKKEKLWLPILISAAISALCALWYADYTAIALRPALDGMAEKYGADFANWYLNMQNMTPPLATAILGSVSAFFALLVTALISALAALAVIRIFFKANVKFRALFSVYMYAALISAAGTAAVLASGVYLDSAVNIFSFAVVTGSSGGVLSDVAGAVSIFTLIYYAAVFFALKKVMSLLENPPEPGKITAAALVTVIVLLAAELLMAWGSALTANSDALADTMYKLYMQTQ
jgi:hypothetical protein